MNIYTIDGSGAYKQGLFCLRYMTDDTDLFLHTILRVVVNR